MKSLAPCFTSVILFQIGPSFLSKNKSSHYNCSQSKPRDRGERNFCPRLLLGRAPMGKKQTQAQMCSWRFMVHTVFSRQWEKPQVCRTPDVLHKVLLTSLLSPKFINNLTLFLNCMVFSPPLTESFFRFLFPLVCPTRRKWLWICFENYHRFYRLATIIVSFIQVSRHSTHHTFW